MQTPVTASGAAPCAQGERQMSSSPCMPFGEKVPEQANAQPVRYIFFLLFPLSLRDEHLVVSPESGHE